MACLEGGIFCVKSIKDVTHAQPDAGSLVAVGGADAFSGGAHFGFALGCFVGTVQYAMGGQNQVCPFADVQPALQIIPCGFQFFGFGHEQVRSQHTAVADDIHLVCGENARRDGAQHEFFAIEDDGVSCIRAAGEACHHVIFWGKHIYYFPFAFVSKDDSQEGVNFSFFHIIFQILFSKPHKVKLFLCKTGAGAIIFL